MSNFLERLGLRSSNRRQISNIRPAITPASLPETFAFPTQSFKPHQVLFTSVPAVNESETIDAEGAVESKKPKVFTERVEVEQSKKPEVVEVEQSKKPEVYTERETIDAEGAVESKKPKVFTERVEVEQSKKPDASSKRTQRPEIIHPEMTDFGRASKKLPKVTDLSQNHVGVLKVPSPQAESPFKDERNEQASQRPVEHRRTEMKEIDDDLTQRPRSFAITMSEINEPRPAEIPEKNYMVKHQTVREPSGSSVTVRIDRIEVRAIKPEKPELKEFRPIVSLEEYLKRRREGSF